MGKIRAACFYLPLVLCALLSASYLLQTPIHGLADNGDFWRVMAPAGIRYPFHPAPVQFRYVQRSFHLQNPELEKSTTSAVIPAFFARCAAALFGVKFDLRFLGAFFLLLFLSGLFLLLRRSNSWVLTYALPWLALEPTLFLHFNSFFSVSLHLAFWPWLLWSILGAWNNERAASAVLLISSLLLATSKAQFLLLPLLLAAILFQRRKRLAYAQLLLCAMSLATLPLYPDGIRRMNDYQATFTGIGLVASDPGRALQNLGVPVELHNWNGRSLPKELLRGELPEPVRRTAGELSRMRLLLSYFTEPGALSGSLARIKEALVHWPLGYLGHFEADTGRAGEELRFPWQYSRGRDSLLGTFPWALWLVPLLSLAIWRQAPLSAFLALHFLSQIPVVILGDGFMALQRHFIVSRLCWDLMAWLLCTQALEFVLKYLRRNEGLPGPRHEDASAGRASSHPSAP